MTLQKKFFYSGAALLSDMTAAYCLFLLFSSTSSRSNGMMTFSATAYFVCGLAALILNCALARRERTLPVIAISNILMSALTAVVVFTAPNGIERILAHIIAAIIFIYPAPRAFSLCRGRVTADIILTYSELSILGSSAFFVCQIGEFSPGAAANALCIISLALNLFSLTSLRMEGALRTSGTGLGRTRRFLIFTLAAALIITAAAALAVILPGSREWVVGAILHIWRAVIVALRAVGRFIEWLLSLLPYSEIGRYEMEAPEMLAPSSDVEFESIEIPFYVIVTIVVIIACAVVGLMAFLIYKFRKLRLGGVLRDSLVIKRRSRAPALLAIIASFLLRAVRKARFFILLAAEYNTSAGIFARLELNGRRFGMERKKGQTPREYLMCLANLVGQEDEPALCAFAQLADEIDLQLFRNESSRRYEQRRHLARVLFRAIKSSRRKNKKTEQRQMPKESVR